MGNVTVGGVVPAAGWWAVYARRAWPHVAFARVIAWRVAAAECDRVGAWVVDERPESWVESADLLGYAYRLGRFHPRWRRAAREALPGCDGLERFLADEG